MAKRSPKRISKCETCFYGQVIVHEVRDIKIDFATEDGEEWKSSSKDEEPEYTEIVTSLCYHPCFKLHTRGIEHNEPMEFNIVKSCTSFKPRDEVLSE